MLVNNIIKYIFNCVSDYLCVLVVLLSNEQKSLFKLLKAI